MKSSLFKKIFTWFVLVIVFFSFLVIFFSFRTIRNNYISSLTERLEIMGGLMMPRVDSFVKQKNYEGLEKYLIQTEIETGTRVTVIDKSGVVLGDSEKDPHLMDNHISRPEISAALKGQGNKDFGYSVRYSSTTKEKMLYLAMPFTDEAGNTVWVIRLSMFLHRVNDLIWDLTGKIINITVLIIILSLVVMFLAARKISDPVRKLGDAAKKMSAGDFNVSVDVVSGDEIQLMADGFNDMARRIKRQFEEISSQKEKLDAIISSMNEPLIVVDDKGLILIANKSFMEICVHSPLKEKADGRYYWEAMLPQRFNEMMEKSKTHSSGYSEHMEINSRAYIINVSFLEKASVRTVVFHDVTGIKEFEEMKKDLVANVSHELKTPLTAIKGFTETMEAETEDEDGRRYLGIIKRHTERLINIVEDLLTLSNLESEAGALNFEDTDLNELVSGTVRMFDKKMLSKNLEMRVYVSENLPVIKTEKFRIEQALINLIDNAVKYTEKGNVTVSVSQNEGGIAIEVSDTGSGIPAESIPRLFERFYTVDRSRSRKLGGTGLGLSIVKHIVMLHGGEIKVESTAGKGSKFTIQLQKTPS
ncbi:MAG: HAMP domain-containing protein [Candidatus Goldbacteria bacterium]|nr:HAMP domain-containing protein [Candidatus Goldiibacteriota bacterium]